VPAAAPVLLLALEAAGAAASSASMAARERFPPLAGFSSRAGAVGTCSAASSLAGLLFDFTFDAMLAVCEAADSGGSSDVAALLKGQVDTSSSLLCSLPPSQPHE
jgi:hypothetical protein